MAAVLFVSLSIHIGNIVGNNSISVEMKKIKWKKKANMKIMSDLIFCHHQPGLQSFINGCYLNYH